MMMSTKILSWNERGSAVIEFALTLPLLLLIVMGIFDFGLMFQRYEVVTNAAREGARIGVLPGYSTSDAEARANQYLNVGGISQDNVATTCGGSIGRHKRCVDVVSGPSPQFGTPPRTVTQVTSIVEYDHEFMWVGPMMYLFGGSSMGTVRLRAVSTMRAESN